MLMLLRRTCDDSWTEPCSGLEGQPLASKGRREAGGVVLAGLDDNRGHIATESRGFIVERHEALQEHLLFEAVNGGEPA